MAGDDHASTMNDDSKDSDSEGEAAEEILEESPCKRWSKRREKVKQRDVPGIDAAYLAMDNETGNEVVWNEVLFSERKSLRSQEEKINAVFEYLTSLVHTNLVKFHRYWTDTKSEKPRIIFITEYMSSGSMSVFLQRTRKSGSKSISFKAWKKWMIQILTALNYLHSANPPITHGNLTCNTIFIQQNGLIKIGCVAPDAIHHNVKTCRDSLKNFYYMAPEYENTMDLNPSADVYAFGVCALEIALVGGPWSPGTAEGPINADYLLKSLSLVEDDIQRDFLGLCLQKDPKKRPTTNELLFHPCLYEVPSLKLVAAHTICAEKMYEDASDTVYRVPDSEKVAAASKFREMSYCEVPSFQLDLEKLIDDVRNGIYPLTAFPGRLSVAPPRPAIGQLPSPSTDLNEVPDEKPQPTLKVSSVPQKPEPDPTPSPPAVPVEEIHRENRTIKVMKITAEEKELTIWLLLEDDMNRQLVTEITDEDSAQTLVQNLVQHGFICEADSSRVERELVGVLTPPT